MKLGLIVTAVMLAAPAHAASTDPVLANEALARQFERAWNTHDMTIMEAMVTDDIDWVNVDGGRGKGREQVVGGHVRVHATPKFKDSVMTIQRVEVAPVRPDIAVVHVYWGMRGDRDNDGKARPPREGVFTWLTVRDAKGWRVRASHNSNRQAVR
jgi:uncharacterized protein (TIGR02246 family)